MGPRRRRWRRRAVKAALVAVGSALVVLVGSGAGEELLAAALAAWGEWGEGGDRGEWGMGPGEPPGGSWGGGFINGERGKGAGLVDGEGGKGAGLVIGGGGKGAGLVNAEGGKGAGFVNGDRGKGAGLGAGGAGFVNEERGRGKRGWGVLNGSSGVTNGGPGGEFEGPGDGFRGPGGEFRGTEGGFKSPGGEFGGSQNVIGVPGDGFEGPGDEIGGPGDGIGGLGDGFEGPGDGFGSPGSPPGCSPPESPRVLVSPAPCAPPWPFLLVLVPSAPPHLERRRAVRDTWGGPPWPGSGSPPVRSLFVLGVPQSPSAQRRLLAESRQHRDILQGDFRDSYANLTLKTLLLLSWARACCSGTPFLLKADDDVFVNVPAVATALSAWPAIPPRLYLGRVHWGVAPNRDPRSRHHVPAEVYPGSRFPPYCSGTAYVLSRQAAIAVLRGAAGLSPAVPEDVWVGLGAARAGVFPRHWARFGGSQRVPPGRCCLGRALLSGHRVRPPEMRRVWGEIAGGEGGCGGLMGWGALGVLRCRVMAWGEWLWGGGGDDVMGE